MKTQQEVINAMTAIQDKTIARQPLTAEEIKIQDFQFRYGKTYGAKEYLKSINKSKGGANHPPNFYHHGKTNQRPNDGHYYIAANRSGRP